MTLVSVTLSHFKGKNKKLYVSQETWVDIDETLVLDCQKTCSKPWPSMDLRGFTTPSSF
jgi:hypothetical protein